MNRQQITDWLFNNLSAQEELFSDVMRDGVSGSLIVHTVTGESFAITAELLQAHESGQIQKDFMILMMQMMLEEMKRIDIVSTDEFHALWARIPERIGAIGHIS